VPAVATVEKMGRLLKTGLARLTAIDAAAATERDPGAPPELAAMIRHIRRRDFRPAHQRLHCVCSPWCSN